MEHFQSYIDIALVAITLFVIAVTAFKFIAAKKGWTKGCMIADELLSALNSSKEIIKDFQAISPNNIKAGNIDSISNHVAAQVSGVTASDVKPIIEHVISGAAAELRTNGVTVSVDASTGDIKVDPTGLANKAAYKVGKWAKKVF